MLNYNCFNGSLIVTSIRGDIFFERNFLLKVTRPDGKISKLASCRVAHAGLRSGCVVFLVASQPQGEIGSEGCARDRARRAKRRRQSRAALAPPRTSTHRGRPRTPSVVMSL